jgi:predicted nucleic-acid-binding protein
VNTVNLDSNIVLRYLLDDDPRQGANIRQLIDHTPGFKFLISDPVLCELIWVLKSPKYGFSKKDEIEVLRGLLSHGRFIFQDRIAFELALDDYIRGPAGFADYLILNIGKGAGVTELITYDKKLASNPHCREP